MKIQKFRGKSKQQILNKAERNSPGAGIGGFRAFSAVFVGESGFGRVYAGFGGFLGVFQDLFNGGDPLKNASLAVFAQGAHAHFHGFLL